MQHPFTALLSPLPLALAKSPSQKSELPTKGSDGHHDRVYPGFYALRSGWQALKEDFRIIFDRDPAAHHWLEVVCCYPGFHAIALYRLAHWLHQHQIVFIPRFLSHLTRFLTGIEIHPGAVIGKGVFIDHGMGVVIGETAIVGDYCLVYQGVTLGGTGKETG